MKRKLKIVFVLIGCALAGIIIFQAYWTVNAYRVNKEKFDNNINIAMQKAMDDCKKDYFDSIRRVLVRRLSPPETTIKIDTLHEKDTINVQLRILLSNKIESMGTPFNTTTPVLEFYRKKINHKATMPEVLTEMSFYVPQLMNDFTVVLGMYDIMGDSARFNAFHRKHPDSPIDTAIKFNRSIPNSIYELPPHFREADSLKLHKYFNDELEKIHNNSGFVLVMSTNSIPPSKLNAHYSETAEFSYKYHGFTLFHIVGFEFFVHAEFRNPQYAILKSLMLTMTLSSFLVLFTAFCFYYIIRTINAQKKLADLKDDFINNMTHELKTPIATITVAIEGLQNFNALNDAEKTQRYLETSRNELARLNDLVTKVLDIAAFENKEIELVKEKIIIDDLVNDVIKSEKSKTAEAVDIVFDNKAGQAFIYGDRVHFRNVLSNLVDNAIKYTNGPANIVVTCYKDGGSLMISVKDNGIGIPPAHLALVFDKFHRVPTRNIHAVKGTGLGLSYVKYIIEAHGGSINVKSEIKKGSEFIVSVPLSDG
jgi:signal transduction histidine kinase